jgi:CubicO group peptidase (beta-lactamase class C family)
MRFRLAVAFWLSLTAPALAQAVPVLSDTGPDAAAYGEAEGYPIGIPGVMGTQRTLVGSYSHYDQLRQSRLIPPAATPSKLDRAATELRLSYTFQGQTHTLDDYLDRNPTTGLLILHDRTIQFEHYRYARTEADRFTSQSMAKTIVGMLLGTAIAEGRIRSVDDSVALYVPELAGTETGRTPLRALLTMSSGLHFREVYDGKDDLSRLNRALMRPESPGAAEVVTQFTQRDAPPGTVWHYAGLDTELLGIAISRATGRTLGDYMAQTLWIPMGAEAAASWIVDPRGEEIAYCCFNATLRDWGRLGALLAHGGTWNGKQIIPAQWVHDSTTPQAPYLAPGFDNRRLGYGYQVWLQPGPRHDFVLSGIYGQKLFVDPVGKFVLVHTAVRPNATGNAGDAELQALWEALIVQGGS